MAEINTLKGILKQKSSTVKMAIIEFALLTVFLIVSFIGFLAEDYAFLVFFGFLSLINLGLAIHSTINYRYWCLKYHMTKLSMRRRK